MKQKNLLFLPPGGTGSSRVHDGRITTEHPNEMWAVYGKKFWTAWFTNL